MFTEVQEPLKPAPMLLTSSESETFVAVTLVTPLVMVMVPQEP